MTIGSTEGPEKETGLELQNVGIGMEVGNTAGVRWVRGGGIGREMADVKYSFGDKVGIWGQGGFGVKSGKEGARGKLGVCPADLRLTAPPSCEMCQPGSRPVSQAETFL